MQDKMKQELLTCQYIFPHECGQFASGFNCRVFGLTDRETNGYPAAHSQQRYAGWQKANDMINEGKIYYTHIFQHTSGSSICKDKSFEYGGSQVCNGCGRKRLAQPWWNIKITRDGSAWFVAGENFENLQESDNYAFGDTKEEALLNYQNLYIIPVEAALLAVGGESE